MLRVIKALLGIALIMVGPLLIVITVDDTVFLKNILLRICLNNTFPLKS